MTKIILTYNFLFESTSPLPIPEMGAMNMSQRINGTLIGAKALSMFLSRDHVESYVESAEFINDRLNDGQWFYVNKQEEATSNGAALLIEVTDASITEDNRAYRFYCRSTRDDSKPIVAQGESLPQALFALTAAMGTIFANTVVRNMEVSNDTSLQLTLGIWEVSIERSSALADFPPIQDAIINPVIAAYHTTVEKAVHPDQVSMDIVVGVGIDGGLSPLKCDITGHQFTRHFQQAAIAEYHLRNNPYANEGASAANCAPDWADAQLTIRSVSVNY